MENDDKKLYKMVKKMVEFFESEPNLGYHLHSKIAKIHESMKEIMVLIGDE